MPVWFPDSSSESQANCCGFADLNREVAQKFSEVAGYAYLDTASIIEECVGKSALEVEQEEGRDTVVVAEASVIEQTALQLRSSISLLGGGWGASARSVCCSHPSCFVRRDLCPWIAPLHSMHVAFLVCTCLRRCKLVG